MEKRYDVFISYSRKNLELVKSIKTTLEESTGVNCWMDLNAIESGSPQFSQDIVDGINNCKVFLFMLSEQSQNSEFALLELNYARDERKHVVLVNIDDCRMTGAFKLIYGLTDQIAWNNQPQQSKLLRDLKRWTRPEISVPAEPEEHEDANVRAETFLKLKSDLDCLFFLDGEEKAMLKAGKLLKFALREGEYELEFVGLENEADRLEMTFEMPPKDTVLHVSLAEKRAVRLEKEATERDEQEEKAKLARENAEQEAKRKLFLQDQTFMVKGVSFVMKPVEGGTFQMGSNDSDAEDVEKPVHSVTVNSFYMGETEVTQALWNAVMGSNPSCFKGDNLPVENVSWNDCQDFICKLNQKTRRKFRLPTEAEWEYAARGGKEGNGYKYAGSNSIGSVAWYDDNSGGKTHAVKGKSPNKLGLYDMSGNVCEWCQDRYRDYGSGSRINPSGSLDGSYRVLRGGDWRHIAWLCRVSSRCSSNPDFRLNCSGFRLCLPQQN